MTKRVLDVYTDAGLCVISPSPYGGAYGYCTLHPKENPDDVLYPTTTHVQTVETKEVFRDREKDKVSANVLELMAVYYALSSLPATWNGKIFTDSQVTWTRLTKLATDEAGNIIYPIQYVLFEKSKKDLPGWLYNQMRDILYGVGTPIHKRIILLAGHPKVADVMKMATGQIVYKKNTEVQYSYYNHIIDRAVTAAIRQKFPQHYVSVTRKDYI